MKVYPFKKYLQCRLVVFDTASCELYFKEIKLRVVSYEFHYKKINSWVASCKHFKRLKLRVANLNCELLIVSASCQLKVRVANWKCELQDEIANCKSKVLIKSANCKIQKELQKCKMLVAM